MAKPARWRRIEVQDVRYRWYAASGQLFVRLESRPGQTLLATFPSRPGLLEVEHLSEVHRCEVFAAGPNRISQRLVRLAVLSGLEMGWVPEHQRGRLVIELQEIAARRFAFLTVGSRV